MHNDGGGWEVLRGPRGLSAWHLSLGSSPASSICHFTRGSGVATWHLVCREAGTRFLTLKQSCQLSEWPRGFGEAGLDQIASAFQCSPWSHRVSPETFQMRRSGIPGHGREQKSFTTSTLRRSLAQYEGRSFSAVVGCFLLKARQRGAGSFLQPRPQEWYHAQVHSAGRLHPYFLRPGSGLPCCCPAGSLGIWP